MTAFASLLRHERAGWRWVLFPSFCGAAADGAPTVYVVDLYMTQPWRWPMNTTKRRSFTAQEPGEAIARAAAWLEAQEGDK